MAALLGANSGVVLRACGHQSTGQQYPYTCKLWRHQWQHSLQFCPPPDPGTCPFAHLPIPPSIPLPQKPGPGQKRHIPCNWAQLPPEQSRGQTQAQRPHQHCQREG